MGILIICLSLRETKQELVLRSSVALFDVQLVAVQIDYARMHGYEFHLYTHVVDKSLPKLCVISQNR